MAKNKANMKKFVTGAITATMVASAVAPVAALADTVDFSDVPTDSSHYPNIVKAAERGLMTGYADGTFKPTLTMNRGQVVKALGKYIVGQEDVTLDAYLEKHDLVKNVTPFEDVPATHVDQELFKYSLVVKDAEAFTGNQNYLNPTNDITRQQMAKVLVNAFDLKDIADVEADVADMDTVFGEYKEYVSILSKHEVTKADDGKFRPAESVTRQQMASFLNRSYDAVHEDETPEVPGVEGITSVKAINDKTVEVNFSKEIDADFIREAERNKGYFAVYKYGDTINGTVIQSTSISFSADGKKAEFTTGTPLQAGERYYVALIDGDNPGVANIVHQYGPAEILEAAKAPDFEVSAVADKIYIKFSEKMKPSALDIDKYEIFDNGGQLLGDLEDYVTDLVTNGSVEEGKWTNATKKDTVEFKLAPSTEAGKKQLRAGETYKIKLKTDLETDSNKKLNKDNTTITVKTPSVKDAAPKAAQARITATGKQDGSDAAKVVVVFDKDVELLLTAGADVTHLVDIKTSTGKKVNADSVTVDKVPGVENELELTVQLTGTTTTDDLLDKAITYSIEIPTNLVHNAVFPNAANEATNGVKATAQDNKAITSLKAQFQVDSKVKGQANLLLTFDQRPSLASVAAALVDEDKFSIKEGTTKYTFETSNAIGDVKYYAGDTTGKTIIVEGINKDAFDVFSSNSYNVEFAAGSVAVDAYGISTPVTNQEKLKSTVNGTAVTAPQVDKVTLVSANEITIEFEEAIDSNVDLNKIEVAGYEADGNGFYGVQAPLTGKNFLDATVSGNKLTLKTKKANTAFATGFGTDTVKIFEDAFTTKGTDLEVASDITIDATNTADYTLVDKAAPVLLNAEEEGTDNKLNLTFTEAVLFEGADADIAKLFRTSGAADKSSVGNAVSGGTTDTLVVTFDENWKGDSTDLLDVIVNYGPGQTVYLKDAQSNKVKATKLNGVKK